MFQLVLSFPQSCPLSNVTLSNLYLHDQPTNEAGSALLFRSHDITPDVW